MFQHSFATNCLAAESDSRLPSTMLIVAVLNLNEPDQTVEMVKCSSGQALADLFNELDRPYAEQAIVGVQLAIPPQLNGSKRWTVEAVLDFARARSRSHGDEALDIYAYRLASDALFTDNALVELTDVLEWRTLYGASNGEGACDSQLMAHQAWLSIVITTMVNAVNLPDEENDVS
ncbi:MULTISPECIES: hypothetical protein [unclassified Pseudomonas]|uniref:hypothetical protein n=1 Tax=unclassified Pseudomonas TaxID=196821 RepID=UPI001F3F69B1|nr:MULTISPECIES: hypothetical protein [unclassified Pseudomonas]